MVSALAEIARELHARTCNDRLPLERCMRARGVTGDPVCGWQLAPEPRRHQS